MQISIRPAIPADAPTLAALTDAAYSRYVPLLGRPPQPMTANYRQIVAEHPVWILSVDDTPAGLLVLIHEEDQMLIYSVAIAPAFQKRGFGRRLLARAEEETRRAGYNRLRLYTNALMVENIALYERLGYHETGRETYLGSTLVHMAKTLEG